MHGLRTLPKQTLARIIVWPSVSISKGAPPTGQHRMHRRERESGERETDDAPWMYPFPHVIGGRSVDIPLPLT